MEDSEKQLERRQNTAGIANAVESIANAAKITASTAAEATASLVKRVDIIDDNLSTVKKKQQEMGEQLKINTASTERVEQNTKDLVTVWGDLKGGMKVLGWLGIAFKWVMIAAGCISAVAGAWFALTHFGGDITPK